MKEYIFLLIVIFAMVGFLYAYHTAMTVATDMIKRYASKLAADNRAEMERRKAAQDEQ